MLTSKKSATQQPSRSYLLHSASTLIGSLFLVLASPVSQADVFAGSHKTQRPAAQHAPQPKPPQMRLSRNLRGLATFNQAPQYAELRRLVHFAAQEHQVDAELLQAIIAIESGFDPQARSHRGAIGLMQLMPITAEHWGAANRDDPASLAKVADPRTNILLGAQQLAYLQKIYPKRLDLVVAAYNAGEGNVRAAGNRIPPYRETQNYVRSVLSLYASLKPGAPIPQLQRI